MGFRCGITGRAAPPGTKPVVVRFLIAREYQGHDPDGADEWCIDSSMGKEIVREVLALPEFAPKQREILLPGIRIGNSGCDPDYDRKSDLRLVMIARALERGRLTISVYPGEQSPELHAYVEAHDITAYPLFVCTIANTGYVDYLVNEAPSSEFTIADTSSPASVVAALIDWARRVFPNATIPPITLNPWTPP